MYTLRHCSWSTVHYSLPSPVVWQHCAPYGAAAAAMLSSLVNYGCIMAFSISCGCCTVALRVDVMALVCMTHKAWLPLLRCYIAGILRLRTAALFIYHRRALTVTTRVARQRTGGRATGGGVQPYWNSATTASTRSLAARVSHAIVRRPSPQQPSRHRLFSFFHCWFETRASHFIPYAFTSTMFIAYLRTYTVRK